MVSPSESQRRARSIARMTKSLPILRKIAGWSIADLGDKIGVTKQTISNLENGKSPISYAQYIAIRSVLDCEMAEHPENVTLKQAVAHLLDDDSLADEESDLLLPSYRAVAAAAAGGVQGEKLNEVSSTLIQAVLKTLPVLRSSFLMSISATGLGSYWLKQIKEGTTNHNSKEDP